MYIDFINNLYVNDTANKKNLFLYISTCLIKYSLLYFGTRIRIIQNTYIQIIFILYLIISVIGYPDQNLLPDGSTCRFNKLHIHNL